MDNSAEKEAPVTAIGAEQAERRSTRRRLVQATLFPHRSPEKESNSGQKGDNCKEDGDGEEENCGSQGKKRRKHNGRRTPQSGTSKKQVKEKSPGNSTPKKNATRKLIIAADSIEGEDAKLPIPDLRLEAKFTAEENSRIFAGKQIHPFFSSWKAGKRNQQTAEAENACYLAQKKDKNIIIGPIHVFERIQDDAVHIDWKNCAVSVDWKDCTFFEKTSTYTKSGLKGTATSNSEGSIKALSSDEFPSFLHPFDASVLQNNILDEYLVQQKDLDKTLLVVSTMLADEQGACCQLFELSEGDSEVNEVSFLSGHVGDVRNSVSRQQSRYLQESNQYEDSLWIDKYQPKRAMEVCGNTESVKFMNEWLHLWHERGFQAIKDSTGSDKDCMFYGCDSDSESTDEGDTLKNVLLVTGPVGSGKSAAIHACAKEQGFKILESNASECRNGALVKQKFGEALESRYLTRSMENSTDLQKRPNSKAAQVLLNGKAMEEHGNEVMQLTSMPDKEQAHGDIETSAEIVCMESNTGSDRPEVKPLILFEDVDITFPEDRGFIAAIQQIAEKAKGPVILTSNNKNLFLPDHLDKLELRFTMPSSKELFWHLFTVCAAEKVDIEPRLVEQLIGYCQGDIRKTIMHLQFWCQSKRPRKARKVKNTCGSLLFDLEAAHQMLPKIIPWALPSQISELVEKEITDSLSIKEENSTLMDIVVEDVDNKEMLNRLGMQNRKTESIEAKKEAMLRRNWSLHDLNEFEDPWHTISELSNISGSLVSISQHKVRRKLTLVVSSDSEDDLSHDQYPLVLDKHTDNELFLKDDSKLPLYSLNMQNCINPLTDKVLHSEVEKGGNYYYSQTANHCHLDYECKSVDVSSIPESTFVPETEINNEADLLSPAVSCGHVSETVEISVSEDFMENPSPILVEKLDKCVHRITSSSGIFGSTFDTIAESYEEEEVEENSHDERVGGVVRGYQMMDECSRMDPSKRATCMKQSRFRMMDECSRMYPSKRATCMKQSRFRMPNDLVQESWKRLRHRHKDLKQYVNLEPKDAFQIVELTNKMSNLCSEADLLLSKCHKVESLELSLAPSKSSNAFSWCNEQMQMASTVSNHGFCIYAKDITEAGAKIVSKTSVDLSLEKLASTTSMMASRKLIGPEVRASSTSNAREGLEMSPRKSEIPLESDRMSSLFNIIKSMVPPRSHLALKGDAFHEYVSSLGCISRSDTSHLLEGIGKTKNRRSRCARHYLSTGTLMLSPEDISMLSQYSLYGKTSS